MIKKYPYKYDLAAGILTLTILVLSGKLERGNSAILNIAGLIILPLAAVLWIIPISHFRKYGSIEKGKKYFESGKIVKGGIYSIVRHPQYLSYMLLVSGFALISLNWIILTLSLVSVSLFYIHAVKEEEELIIRFGNEYLEYIENVPGFNLLKGIIKKFFGKSR